MTEALYFGLPAILTDVGGAGEVLAQPGMGMLIMNSFGDISNLDAKNLGRYTHEESPDNLEELINAMEDMITRQEYWKGLASIRRKHIEENYPIEKAVMKTIKVFKSFLGTER
jgi:glycosyltransferase involved in cell wall biosynthesis